MARSTSATATRRGPLVSPGSIADPAAAFVAWCNMPHAQRADFKKPRQATWIKNTYPRLRAKYLAEHGEPQGNTRSRRNTASNDPQAAALAQLGLDTDTVAKLAAILNPQADEPDVDPRVQALIDKGIDPDVAQQVIDALGGDVPAPTGNAGGYEQRTPTDEIPEDAARNSLLWALNSEGLLMEAYEASAEAGNTLDNGEAYITQDVGQSTMTAHFGPLVPAANRR